MSNSLDIVDAFLAVEDTMEDYNHTLGLKVISREVGKVIMELPISEKAVNIYGIVHGGALAGLLDTCMGLTCFTLGKQVVTLDMHLTYVKSAKLGETVRATSKVIHVGNSTVMLEAAVENAAHEILCKASASFFVVGEAKL